MLTGVLIVVVALTLESCSGIHTCYSTNSLRLYNQYGNTNTQGGMLQVCQSSIWRAVCDYSWDCTDARAACRQLGYSGSRLKVWRMSNSARYFGSWSYYYNYYYTCSSSSTSLTSCSRSTAPSSSYCHSDNHAGLQCTTVPPAVSQCVSGSVRLVGGQSSREGRLEYCYYGVWSPFCYLLPRTATVACKQMGYTNSPKTAIFTDGRFGTVSNYSLFRYFSCSSPTSQSSLSSCYLYGDSYCSGRICSASRGLGCYESGHDGCTNGAVRLVNSTTEYEGRVEVCYDGIWGTVCGVDILDAIVICNTLGYGGASAHYSSSKFGDGGRPIVYNLRCNGYEKNIQLCNNYSYGIFSCSQQSVAGVTCHHGCTDGDVRLTGGSSATEGTVEVCLNQTWGLVSGLGWGVEDARVVCRQLRFQAEGSVSFADTPFGKPNSTVYYSSVQCTGSETRLTNCATNKLTFEQGKQLFRHISVAGVSCNIECSSPTQHAPVTVTNCKVTTNPRGSQLAQPAALSESGYTLTTFSLTGVSGILGIMTVALGVGLCCTSYKLKKRRNTTGQTADNDYDGPQHNISTASAVNNAYYKRHNFPTAPNQEGVQQMYNEVVNIK